MERVIHDVPGIGPAAAKLLAEHSINTAADLATASIELVVAVPGFSQIRATRVIAAAAELLATAGKAAPLKDTDSQSGTADKSAGKKSKGKKSKKAKKDKKGKKSKGKGKGKGKGKKKSGKKGKK